MGILISAISGKWLHYFITLNVQCNKAWVPFSAYGGKRSYPPEAGYLGSNLSLFLICNNRMNARKGADTTAKMHYGLLQKKQ